MAGRAELDSLLDFESVKGSFAALAALDAGELTTGALADSLGIADQTATKLRKHLESHGLVQVTSRKARGATEQALSLTVHGRRAAKLAIDLGKVVRRAR